MVIFGSGRPSSSPAAERLRLENPTTIVAGGGHPHRLRRVHGIAQMRDTHTGDDFRISEEDRGSREVIEQPHSCA